MKKTITIMAALCMAVVANAKIIRVSNVEGSSAPYSSFDAAQNAAVDGDTIMFDGSTVNYGSINISKSIVLIGPGYFLKENGINMVSPAPARLDKVEMWAEGIVMQGMMVEGRIDILFPKCVINRCRVGGLIQLWGPHDEGWSGNAINCVIHQNFLTDRIAGDEKNRVITISNTLITNNIFLHGGSSYVGVIDCMKESTIAYNTWTSKSFYSMLRNIYNSTINNNIFPLAEADSEDDDNKEYPENLYNSRNNNVFLFEKRWSQKWEECDTPFAWHTNTDSEIKTIEEELYKDQAGAFSGNSPYVISGVPAGPVINDIDMPTTVEMGSKLNVTIKVDISR